MLAFQPQTEEEVLNLLKPGVYDFEVKRAEDAISKSSGNPMIKLTLVTWDEKGNERYVTDYLMASLMYKVKHFTDSTGLEEKYQAGTFSAADCEGRTGKFKLRIEESEGYAPKNAVQDYVKGEKRELKAVEPTNDAMPFNDDVPF